MNKKELLNELLKNFPEFEKDKKSLEKTLDFMLKNNPKVEVDTNFKKSLRKKIETISDLKSRKKKNNFWIFAIPSFSFMFIITGVFYIYKDMIFENNSLKNINIENSYKLEGEDFLQKSQQFFDEKTDENETSILENKLEKKEGENLKTDKEKPKISPRIQKQNSDKNNYSSENFGETKQDNINPDIKNIQNSPKAQQQEKSIHDSSNENLEDTQFSDFIQDIEGEIEKENFGDTTPSSFNIKSGENYTESKTDFENFERICNLYEGVYDTNKNICTKNKVICDYDDYIAEVCPFFSY